MTRVLRGRQSRRPLRSRPPAALAISVLLGTVLAGCSGRATLGPHRFSEEAPAAKQVLPARAAPSCQATQLLVRVTANYLEASNEFEQPVIVTNRSDAPCRLKGWPELTVFSSAAQPIPTEIEFLHQHTSPSPMSSSVLLNRGESASFAVSGEGFDAADNRACPRSSSWQIDLPSVRSPIHLSVSRPACKGAQGVTLFLTPLLPGLSMRRFQDFGQVGGSVLCDGRCGST